MRTHNEWLCDTLGNPGCQRLAAVNFLCKVEGSDIALCRICFGNWKERARTDAGLSIRCPRCAAGYLEARASATAGSVARSAPGPASEPLAGPLADAVNAAMLAEGLLVNARFRILARLNADTTVQDHILGALGAARVKQNLEDLQSSLGRYTDVNAQVIMDLLDPNGLWKVEDGGGYTEEPMGQYPAVTP